MALKGESSLGTAGSRDDFTGMRKRSKYLSYLLRHDKDYDFTPGGWRAVSDLKDRYDYSMDELRNIVINDLKGRYEFSEDGSYIRAKYGHSIIASLNPMPADAPDILYHGTSVRFLDSIQKNGIISKTRRYVHLSEDIDTALQVGKRHGKPVVLQIAAKEMQENGIIFLHPGERIWQTEYVDWKYCQICNID